MALRKISPPAKVIDTDTSEWIAEVEKRTQDAGRAEDALAAAWESRREAIQQVYYRIGATRAAEALGLSRQAIYDALSTAGGGE